MNPLNPIDNLFGQRFYWDRYLNEIYSLYFLRKIWNLRDWKYYCWHSNNLWWKYWLRWCILIICIPLRWMIWVLTLHYFVVHSMGVWCRYIWFGRMCRFDSWFEEIHIRNWWNWCKMDNKNRNQILINSIFLI